ncbi:oxygenase MpaB family protein [Actinocorallia sp. A-T 12471]|uniref:oxygenase MpaB family protein n=1 Tax=Actinocorallia sp. A-T 12471 TaxID=3089813 RepID=UPI0029CD00FB|nr:oxygenase MpaB family protein [Actinocorallia sp. A-T 12471]MDX6739906.1 oxygenase MpaB family protein [Actinocorallia sp. A-T 12471]
MTDPVSPLPEDHPISEDGPAPRAVQATLNWYALALGLPNVLMQLSNIKVGYGVAESRVESGRLDRHPVKRLRTTLTFLAVATHGNAAERAYLREEINRAHRQVVSRPGSKVKYNAFDRELQLWVAACLYKGTEDMLNALELTFTDREWDELYQHSSRLATSLQVPRDMWPPDRESFAKYWNDSLSTLETDDYTRTFLRDLAGLAFLPTPLRAPLAPLSRFVTTGFLPQEFRDEIGLTWTPLNQTLFTRFVHTSARLNRALPPTARQFPFNLYLRDFRRRMRHGRPVV